MIELDGSQGEGGGQILRTGLALSMITGQTLRLHHIRAKRPKPGLMRQHLACVQAAAQISSAQVQGAELGSQQLHFQPGPVQAGDYRFAIASAGSCMLVLQTVLPALLLANGPSQIHLSGGTHNPLAPSFHFLERAYAPLVRRLGADLQLSLLRCGFYPAGGGQVNATIHPASHGLQPFDLLQRGALQSAQAECLTPGLPRHVARRELEALGQSLGWTEAQLQMGIARQNEGPGNALHATLAYDAVTELFSSYGIKGVSAEQVAHQLAQQVRQYQQSQAAIGPHLADQLVLLLALAVWQSGQPAQFSCSELTLHTQTNCEVIARFLPVTITWQTSATGTQISLSPDSKG